MPFDSIVSTPSGTRDHRLGRQPAGPGRPATSPPTFSGQFVNINDNCGADQPDARPATSISAGSGRHRLHHSRIRRRRGNTHASRTGFHELNRIIEMGRGQLPGEQLAAADGSPPT